MWNTSNINTESRLNGSVVVGVTVLLGVALCIVENLPPPSLWFPQ
jgi:hypothetical protein